MSNIYRKLVTVVPGVSTGRKMCRRLTAQPGSAGNSVAAAGYIESATLPPAVSSRKTTLRTYPLRLNVVIALLLLVLGAAAQARAAGVLCSEFGGVVDGNNPATLTAIQSASTFGIDTNCTIKNFSQSIGGFPITNINFNFPQQQSYYIAFLDVFYYGHMSCNDPTQSDFWIYWAPGGFNNISPSCQAFMVPVDAVSKKNPPAQTVAAIGVPFTYTITVPLLGKLDATGTFQYMANADDTTVTNVVIPDDLTATGAALSYVSNKAYLVNPATGARAPLNGGAPLTLGASSTWLANHPGILSDASKHPVFSFEYNPALAALPAGNNLEIELTVVLDNNPANVNLAGTQFTNTAKMWFDKPINATSMADLQAWPGTTLPMTVVEPNLTLTKTGSASTVNVDSQLKYTLNIQNSGGSDAWNTTITDRLPAGMGSYSPVPTVTAQIFASDGVTPVSAPLVNGTDYQLTWSGGSGPGQLTLTTLDTTKIAPTQRLLITYQAQLDSTGIASGTTFTNIAAATRWYSANSSYAGRRQYDRTITDGTPGTLDFQDVYQVTAALSGYYFQKTVKDLTTGSYPASTAFPGDRLHYTLLLQNFTWPALDGVAIIDNLPAGLASIANVTVTPAGGTTSVTQPSGGTPGSITVTGLTLPGGATTTAQIQIDFDATLSANLTDGTLVTNQANLSGTDSNGTAWAGPSDDPYVGGTVLLGSGGDPTRVTIQSPGALSKVNTQSSATIGQQFSYLIKVPATPVNVPLYDVRILDNLGLSAANMTFVSAQVIAGGAWNLTNTGTAASIILQDLNTGIDIPAGGQAVIQVTAVLQNTATNQRGVTFTNSASYTYDKINGDSLTQATGGAATTAAMTVVEPHLTAVKAVNYAVPAGKAATAPAAPGDVLRYTVTISNDGSSAAYDTDVMDFLPANVALVPGSATAQINGTAVSGFKTTPTILAGGAVVWGNRNGDTSLDIPAGRTLVLAFQATVVTTSGAPITNSAYVDWTSLSGAITGERTGAGCPNVVSPNSYCAGPVTASVTSLDPTAFAKSVVSDSWTTTPSTGSDSTLRIGDTAVYSLALTLREGVTQNTLVTDQLPAGLAFDSLVSILPASGSSNFTYTPVSQPAPGDTGTITWNLGNISNTVDNNPANNTLVIQYRARVVNNTLAQSLTAQQLSNNAALGYAISGAAATPKAASATINVWQPLLNVSKSAVTANGGTVISAGELITYTVKIANSGAAPAYNPVLTDMLPAGLRQAGVTVAGITLVNSATSAVTATLPTLAPVYSALTGVATWNFDVAASPGLYAVPPGQTLQVVYQVRADSGLGAGRTLNNQALVTTYYSFDSQEVPVPGTVANRQVYGPTSTATVQLTSAAATALLKQAQVSKAAIGQPFTYSITVPAVPQATALYDVRILDDLGSAVTGVDLSFVTVQRLSGPAFMPVNTGTATNLVIQDTTNGIDIPAGQQIVVNVTLVLGNTANNTLGKQFQNTATYSYDSIDNRSATQANGAPGASGAITIVGPALTMQKSGPGTMTALAPGTFTLNVQNSGGSTAWQTTIKDILPNVTTPSPGSMCSAPVNVTARIYQADGVTPVSPPLASGTDFTVSFAGVPACSFTVAMKSPATAILPTDRLIVTYSASLDPNTAGGIALTNIAGATQWLSADPAVTAPGNIQTITGPLTNGTPGVVDSQDAFTLITQAPLLTFTKTVQNVTSGQSGASARPGDTLQYNLTIQNVGTLGAANFTLTDDLDKLHSLPMFAPGSLKLINVPAGTNTALTTATGGSKGTGLVSISSLNITPQGQTGDTLVIQFQVTLAAVIDSGSQVANQAQIGSPLLPTQVSDDPSITGVANPTRTLITSAPAFQVLKTVHDVTSGSAVVMAGDTLAYTITVKNIGTENATGVTLRDLIPANTAYVASSTTLNGAVVADPGAGVSALQNGMLINSPANLPAGAMPANAATTPSNVATVSFRVQVSKNVVAGTLIANQGFVNGSGAASGSFLEQPSDNPATPVVNDPTTVVVGNLPLIYALKGVQLALDLNGNGVVDPGDTLRYAITVTNSGATPATELVLTDAVPANTAYVAGTVQINGAAVGDPAPGVSPLVNGLRVSGGTLAAGGTAVVTFMVQVNPGVATGTIISNQGGVATAQLPQLLTDADGNPTNGYQPTLIAVGNAQQLAITKSAAVVGGGAALPGSVLEYTIQATNIGTVPATSVVLTDDLTPLLAQATYVANSATMNGSGSGVSFTAPVITAGYGTLSPGGSVIVRLRVTLNAALATGSIVTNSAQASWNSPSQIANASTSVAVGGMPGSGSLGGLVWHDANFSSTLDSGEPTFANWAVDLYENGRLAGTATTAADGSYHFSGVTPNAGTSIQYELRFRGPGAGANTALLGWCSSPFTNGMQRITSIIAGAGGVLRELNLPLTPNGVVYNTIMRTPVAGATLIMVQAASKTPLAGSCFNDPAQQGQVTPGSGHYKFDLNFSDPSCPSGREYLIQATPPASGYMTGLSKLAPPVTSGTTAAFSVPACPGTPADAVSITPDYCEAQGSSLAPGVSVPAGTGTAYYLHLALDNARPGNGQIYNNHIALDPTLDTAFAITKSAGLVNVTRGQLVPYTITLNNTLGVTLRNLSVVDTFPPGFKYVAGSARMDGEKIEPAMNTRQLVWSIAQLGSSSNHSITFLMIPGSGVSEGEYVNRAQVMDNATAGAASGVAFATVRVTADPDVDCTDIIGKVFDDSNANGYPDEGEKGLPGARVVTARGLISTTDEYGRFHISCGVVPDEDRGSNFILKLDDRTLPTGYRLTGENPQVQRATRGKMLRFNFGATIHHVVSLDIAAGAFAPKSTQLRLQWQPRIGLLLKELRKKPAVLRLSYLAENESSGLVEDRLKALKKEISAKWDGAYPLTIETEVFWRRGSPP